MKNKLFTVFLIIIFIVLLLFINTMLNDQNNSTQVDVNNITNQNLESEVSSDMEVMSVSNENFEGEVLKSDKKVLIDFYADWCGPCKMLSPIVEEVARDNSDIKVVKINIDENEELAVKYGVASIPTLIVIENGEVKNIRVGLMSKSEVEELVK